VEENGLAVTVHGAHFALVPVILPVPTTPHHRHSRTKLVRWLHTHPDHGFRHPTTGTSEPTWWDDNNCDAKCYLYDPTQQSAREYVWSKLQSGYHQYGIKIFWLDASEPEISTRDAQAAADNYNNSLGTGQEVSVYPLPLILRRQLQ
jgi:hypothetical protein